MRIRFGEPISLEVPIERLPPDSLRVESDVKALAEGPFRVYIVWDVYKQMWAHINEDPNIESGGILVGYPFKDKHRNITFLIIVAAIRQDSENRGLAYFTVGPEEIADARAKMELEYPGLVAVGWYHSHPGHGIFLSGQDMTIVRSIYNEDWHVALVIDPKQRAEGIFVGSDGIPIGGRGGHPLRSTWFPIKSEPDSVKAIALYNQIREAIKDQKRQKALETIERLEELLEKSVQLTHWGYRDLDALKANLFKEEVATLPDDAPFSKANPTVVTPEPARDKNKKAKTSRWPLWVSLISTMGFVVFFIFVVIGYPDDASNPIILGLGAVMSLIAMVTAVYLIVSRVTVAENVAAVVLMSVTLLVWVGFAVFQNGEGNGFTEFTETPVSVPVVDPALQPTATRDIVTPTLIPSSTPTISPTATVSPTTTVLPTSTVEALEIIPSSTATTTLTPVFSEPISPTITASPTITVTSQGAP